MLAGGGVSPPEGLLCSRGIKEHHGRRGVWTSSGEGKGVGKEEQCGPGIAGRLPEHSAPTSPCSLSVCMYE